MRSLLQSMIFSLAAALALAVSCRSPGGSDGPFRELEFRIDSTLLGDPIRQGGLVFCTPRGWEEADSAVMAAIHRGLADRAADDVLPELDGVRIHAESGAVLVVTTFASSPGRTGDFAGWARRFVERYRAANPEVPAEEDWLKIGGVPAVQLYQADSARVQFQYLLRGERVIGLHYSVPRAAWREQVQAVESSVGTVREERLKR